MLAPTDKKIWFPAKTYGWGWGFPVCWQGWVVLGVYVVLVATGAVWLGRERSADREHSFIVYIIVLSVIYLGICWLKGEPLAWRWGKK